MGQDGKGIRLEELGPQIGVGSDLESRRTNSFIESCFQDVLKSRHPEDVKFRTELNAIVSEKDLFERRKDRIREMMFCGECHHPKGVGALTFPYGIAIGHDEQSLHSNWIYDGSMPANDHQGELRPTEVSCTTGKSKPGENGQPQLAPAAGSR